ncbi:helix-turn-helix transcriptional regulator [Pseudonocardia xinjiangensis]|uniref:helix-turn-helix transcriptional regulator n=1 Tax=Pseudonocardia xinjiangensis TaxID=75289 RepID=UPI003D8C8DD5
MSGDHRPHRRSALWLWSSDEASRALRSRDLANIFKAYRRLNGLSQERLAQILGYDKTYISMIETRRRTISDVGALRSIAHTLAIPTHVFGVTDADDATFAAMLQFAGSVLSLADVARRTGRAADAVNELWPLVARLEARAADGFVDRDSLTLLSRARAALGIALGTLLPEERLATAARWTGQSLAIAERLGDQNFLAHILAMHGNELRKAGRLDAAIARLVRATDLARTPEHQASTYAFLARAAGEAGAKDLFDTSIDAYRRHLDNTDSDGMLTNNLALREIRLRGLIDTGRVAEAVRLHADCQDSNIIVAPQWMVIERITAGHVLLTSGEQVGGTESLATALAAAETYHLPHQVQRIARIAAQHRIEDIVAAAQSTLERLQATLAYAPQ